MKILRIILLATVTLVYVSCTQQTIDDSTITAKVKGSLAADKDTSAIKISVETHDGVVTLTGVVPTDKEKARAGEVAKNTEGVRRVVNALVVDPKSIGASNIGEKVGEATERAREKLGEAAESAGESLSDAAILAKIKSQYLAKGIKGTHVEVKDGAVTITGEVDNAQQKAMAEEIARKTKGVHSVKNRLTVKRS
jgi:hyperosmotically inducible protein